ncbi:MAG: hypothetical protein ACTSXD_11650 [Candidatus Heimdallarchaeaceae archaeon]
MEKQNEIDEEEEEMEKELIYCKICKRKTWHAPTVEGLQYWICPDCQCRSNVPGVEVEE